MSVRSPRNPADAFRVEAWEADGDMTVLALAGRGRLCLAVALRAGPAGAGWHHAEAWLPRRAFGAPRDAVAAALPFAPATRAQCLAFLRRPVALAARLSMSSPSFSPDLSGAPDASSRDEGVIPSIEHPDRAAPSPLPAYSHLTPPDRDGPGPRPVPRLGLPPEAGTAETPGASLDPGTGSPLAWMRVAAVMAESIEAAGDALWAHAGREVADLVGHAAWTPALHAHHADPATRTRRLQALALHPWAGETLLDPGIAALVDAGRPFEGALADLATGWSRGLSRAPLDVRRLGRLRGMQPVRDPLDLLRILEAAARMPPSRAPAPPGEPARDARIAHACALFLDGLGAVEGGDLLRSARASIPAGTAGQPFDQKIWLLRESLWDVGDMVAFLAETLGGPVTGRPGQETAAACARLLAPDLDLARLVRASRRWHRDFARFRESLPGPPPGARWPALFEPLVLPGGIGAACLTDPAALAAEGDPGPDAEGRPGLGHCVGSYAWRCLEGASHIVSLRAPDGARLSTLEIVAHPGETPWPSQHRGRGNGKPPEAAVEAARLLLEGLADGTVPLARGGRRDPTWPSGDPARVAESVRAWAPFLPRGLRDADALRAKLETLMADGTSGTGQA